MRRQDFSPRLVLALLAIGMWMVPGPACAAQAGYAVRIDAAVAWTETGVDLVAGQAFRIVAEGRVQVLGVRWPVSLAGDEADRWVGPDGTYVWPRQASRKDALLGADYPLSTMAAGPAPAFGLIGRIGDLGQPFVVGARYEGVAEQDGRLWLGLNDTTWHDNTGVFDVVITLDVEPTIPPRPPRILPGDRTGHPMRDARVVLLYVDGLRPDVFAEMADRGFLPHLASIFRDGGVECHDAFTVFPSNTLTSNASLFTGLFSDRTGIKSQNQFERSTHGLEGGRSRRTPGWLFGTRTRVVNLLDRFAPQRTANFLRARGIPTLGSRLGKAFRFTTLPIAPLHPPPQWLHHAMNTLGPFQMTARLPQHLDTVNAQYAINVLLGDQDARVIAIWFPMVDSVSHDSPYGQFGAARRALALVDRHVGRILERLQAVGWTDSTYFILVSDHGHAGGEVSTNRSCHLARDWAHRTLGTNVRVVDQRWEHPGMPSDRFLFFDHQGFAQAKLYLPNGSYLHGAWRRNRLYELTRYFLRPGQRTVNLIESLAAFVPPGWDGSGRRPIDLILVKLDETRTWMYRDASQQAILHRLPDAAGPERYRYEPIQDLEQSADGVLHYEPAPRGVDPLGYLTDAGVAVPGSRAQWFTQAHTASEWLEATARTSYPDAVVAVAKFFAWQQPVSELAEVRDPDLVVTAAPGWTFRADGGRGTDHGSLQPEAMRITLYMAGPNISPGVLTRPHRIIDVLPTMLTMIGWPDDLEELDGQAMSDLYD